MTITFNEIYPGNANVEWANQPFSGFCLDSRKVQAGQIFIALDSLSHSNKTRIFAENALSQGALGIISESDLGVTTAWVCPQVRQWMGGWQKQYLQATQPVNSARILAVTGTNGKTTISRLIAELI
ncbi:MAG TPA: UDP-N-acetylmuramoyl-L-alanyl-D-glutamate--2,6-diaminopimelate ligase, partial [Acinetobacter radioresistens]|nr:UDP-N-acetylmuramoyl-L-alanyl-D-glutamate--2,6-diaminopimelate ligase [Acinetobacter radioresistens]